MTPQYDNRVMSNFLLFVENRILNSGQAYTNTSSLFYPTTQTKSGEYNYSSPYKGFVYDSSVSGANIMSGVYLNGNYVGIGQSGLLAVDHLHGSVSFGSQLPAGTVVSGNFALKEFNVKMTDEPDFKLLFETKYSLNPKHSVSLTGLAPDTQTYPIIYVRKMNSENVPFCFGADDNQYDLRLIVLADSAYSLDAVCGVLKSSRLSYVDFMTVPFDKFQRYTGVSFNYSSGITRTGPLVLTVRESRIQNAGQFATLPAGVKAAFVDFELSSIRSL